MNETDQRPLASPSAAESHMSMIIGPEATGAAELDSISPNHEKMRTFPFLIGRKNQRSGMSTSGRCIDAVRSSVRVRQLSSRTHRAA